MPRWTQEQALQRAIDVWGDKYDLTPFVYNGSMNKIKAICPIHGEFEILAHRLLNGYGCPKCAKHTEAVKQANKNKTKTLEEFIAEARQVHGDFFDYSKVVYVNSKTKVCIICPVHGEFWQTPTSHLRSKYGCPLCRNKGIASSQSVPYEDYVRKARSVHGDNYSYPKEGYRTGRGAKIDIICPKHGMFSQNAAAHLAGQGCPMCRESRGERKVAKWLDLYNVDYEHQYKIYPDSQLFSSNVLRVDFYLPKHNVIIEYNGIQHYILQKYWQTEERFADQQDRDRRVREYCKRNKIILIEIPYTELDNINKILNKKLKWIT